MGKMYDIVSYGMYLSGISAGALGSFSESSTLTEVGVGGAILGSLMVLGSTFYHNSKLEEENEVLKKEKSDLENKLKEKD